MFGKVQRIHFVGIGGAGMSGIAEILLALKCQVTGSDLKVSEVTERLRGLGAKVFAGHDERQIEGADVLVTSTAVSPDNPEVLEARRRGIPIIPRIEMLAEIARLKHTIAVAGSHGKTTTTSLAALVLQAGNLDPTVVIGGRLHSTGTGARVGKGKYLVAEADESDGSFLKLSPTLAVITNIDDDHLDHWKTMDALDTGFVDFANKIPFYGAVFMCADDPGVQRVRPRIQRPVVTYGFSETADLRAEDIRFTPAQVSFRVRRGKDMLGLVRWACPGRHNILNALAAIGVGLETGLLFGRIAESLSTFTGVGRRLELKGEAGGVTVVDDYGHHPTEIKATIEALRQRWPDRRVVALFQPHRYTRTKQLMEAFATAFTGVDQLFLLDIYPAGEKPLPGVTSDALADRLRAQSVLVERLLPTDDEHRLVPLIRANDVVLTLGAGDVWKWGEKLLPHLHRPA
jgi:UDP-N-acetylmuramate--alanine ligase